jgi:hypothetical protein
MPGAKAVSSFAETPAAGKMAGLNARNIAMLNVVVQSTGADGGFKRANTI